MNILDIGAGSNVDRRATHAVDLQAPMWLKQDPELSRKVNYYPEPVNLGPMRFVEFGKKINPFDRLPYEDGYFHIVVSYSALGVADQLLGEHGFSEAYRVLKKHGILEIGVPYEFEQNEKGVIQCMEKAGFLNINISRDTKYIVIRGVK